MDPKIEKKLVKSMEVLGGFVEKIIFKAEEVQKKMTSKKPVEPILAIESQIALSKIKEIIRHSLERILSKSIPNLVDKSALDICEGELLFAQAFEQKGAAVNVHVDIGRHAGTYPLDKTLEKVQTVRALSKSLPFEDGFFDYVIANFATPESGDIIKSIKEVSRIVTLRGRIVIVDFHPFGRFAKRGSVKLRPFESVVNGFEDYYKICKGSGLRIDDVREIFFDDFFRPYFDTEEDKTGFRSLKDTPFLTCLFVSKRGR